MAVSVAAAYVNNDGGTSVTTGNFDLVANDCYVLVAHSDESLGTTNTTFTVSDNQTPDLTWTSIREEDSTSVEGAVAAWYLVPGSAVSGYNVTVAVSGTPGASDSPAVKVFRIPAGEFDAADIVGAITGTTYNSANLTTASITPETSGNGFVVGVDWQQQGAPTSSDTTFTGFDTTGDISGGSGYKSLTAGVGATANFNPAGAGAGTGTYIWFEIRAGAGGGSTPTKGRLSLLGVGV